MAVLSSTDKDIKVWLFEKYLDQCLDRIVSPWILYPIGMEESL